MKKLTTIFVLMILLFGCSSKNAETDAISTSSVKSMDMKMMDAPPATENERSLPMPPPPPAPDEIQKPLSPNTPKKIIHTADIRFKVDDLRKAEMSIKARVQAMGGYISNTNQNRQSGNLENFLDG